MDSAPTGRLQTTAPTALLVEDESHVRTYISTLLRHGGFEVVEAADAADALSRIRELRGDVDVLVTDVKMPGMTGIELVDLIMADFSGIPVVYISGEPLAMELHAPQRRRVFLQKPFLAQAILEAVRGVIAQPVSADGPAASR